MTNWARFAPAISATSPCLYLVRSSVMKILSVSPLSCFLLVNTLFSIFQLLKRHIICDFPCLLGRPMGCERRMSSSVIVTVNTSLHSLIITWSVSTAECARGVTSDLDLPSPSATSGASAISSSRFSTPSSCSCSCSSVILTLWKRRELRRPYCSSSSCRASESISQSWSLMFSCSRVVIRASWSEVQFSSLVHWFCHLRTLLPVPWLAWPLGVGNRLSSVSSIANDEHLKTVQIWRQVSYLDLFRGSHRRQWNYGTMELAKETDLRLTTTRRFLYVGICKLHPCAENRDFRAFQPWGGHNSFPHLHGLLEKLLTHPFSFTLSIQQYQFMSSWQCNCYIVYIDVQLCYIVDIAIFEMKRNFGLFCLFVFWSRPAFLGRSSEWVHRKCFSRTRDKIPPEEGFLLFVCGTARCCLVFTYVILFIKVSSYDVSRHSATFPLLGYFFFKMHPSLYSWTIAECDFKPQPTNQL